MGSECDVTDTPVCDIGALYSSLDGSCNNLKHPEWGMTNRAQARYLPPDYDDGMIIVTRIKQWLCHRGVSHMFY